MKHYNSKTKETWIPQTNDCKIVSKTHYRKDREFSTETCFLLPDHERSM